MLKNLNYKNVIFVSIVLGIVSLLLSTYWPILLISSTFFLLVASIFVSLLYGKYYKIFKSIIEIQKRKLLENLAAEYGEGYLKLKTPFTAKEERYIQNNLRSKKITLFILWGMSSLLGIAIIAMLF